jgi:hypothetical protein
VGYTTKETVDRFYDALGLYYYFINVQELAETAGKWAVSETVMEA